MVFLQGSAALSRRGLALHAEWHCDARAEPLGKGERGGRKAVTRYAASAHGYLHSCSQAVSGIFLLAVRNRRHLDTPKHGERFNINYMLARALPFSMSFVTRGLTRPHLVSSTQRASTKVPRQPALRTFTSNTTRPRTRAQPFWSNLRQGQKQQRGYRQPFNYNRFQATRSGFRKWASHPHFYYHVAGIGGFVGGVYVYNLEEVPVSHRRRFNIVSPETEAKTGQMMYEQTLQEYGRQILPASHPKSRMVQRVLNRLIPHSGLENEKWEVHVINDDMKNAFVIPGGKVFVFSGILDVCQGDDGLAAVLGHEIAHNVAHHAAERMSQSNFLLAFAVIGSLLLGIDAGFGNLFVDYAFMRPGSRAQESEADYIGLLMMAESCYNPEAAMELWARMEKEEQGAPPQFLSTHPSNHNRLEKIREWLPEADMKREEGDCGGIGGYGTCF